MQVCRLKISNFRGIKQATLYFPKHGVLLGDNNTGKTTLLEALDLVLGPDRISRTPCVDEHDFYQGQYLKPKHAHGQTAAPIAPPVNAVPGGPPQAVAPIPPPVVNFHQAPFQTVPLASPVASTVLPVSSSSVSIPPITSVPVEAPRIEIEATISHLSEDQKGRFVDYIEYWDTSKNVLYTEAQPAGVDAACMSESLRVTFIGYYDEEEDDFEGKTYFTRSMTESATPQPFSKKDKQLCGFLYLRSLRTGSRALSLERGSLLDIVLRLKEVRPQMWEATIGKLDSFLVASDPSLGLSGVLESINDSLKRYVPKEWGVEPHLKVSNLTREHLRKVITAFIATGDGNHAAPFFRQGTGTINMLVLAMLSEIAQDKQNVIFAMEEPETAIPPYAQKRIVHEIRKLASQTMFTSHSPYVLEEFSLEETVVLARDNAGVLKQLQITLPDSVKPKRYRQEFRTRFCEGLLARRVLIAEGATEAAAFPVICRHLAEVNPSKFRSLESLGICTVDAGGEANIASLAKLYRDLGKMTFALCDQQSQTSEQVIKAEVKLLLMHSEAGMEELVLKNAPIAAMIRFANKITWPQHLFNQLPITTATVHAALYSYFTWTKADWGIADFLAQCDEAETPQWLRDACTELINICDPPSVPPPSPPPPGGQAVPSLPPYASPSTGP